MAKKDEKWRMSGHIHVTRRTNPDKTAEYANAVKSTKGPKHQSIPILEHSFTRPIVDGQVGHFVCSECAKKFYTTVSWGQHLKRFAAQEAIKHEAEFEPDLDRSHHELIVAQDANGEVIAGVVTIHHNKLPTPRNEVKKTLRVWQGLRRQGFEEWRYFLVEEARKYTLYLGCSGKRWVFKKVRPTGEEFYSIEYASKELALLYWDMVKITWK